MAVHPPQDLEQHLKILYHTYRHTPDIDAKSLFFSPTCLQICRPTPSYSATSRSQIVRHLKDAQAGKVPLTQSTASDSPASLSKDEIVAADTGRYTIRPLRSSEHSFGDGVATAAVGLTPADLQAIAEAQGWIGMRVDLWDERSGDTLLVKVQYWWRLEAAGHETDLGEEGDGKVWRQCLHDIMYLGPRDSTEGEMGLEIMR
ncbi:hypothetical protein E8E12_002033 [Didymella heteroderae]|uniref:SnoaL-like domain-containing protein n=1 Tax=Didymella heteroderae TaxID=1769908 RepID=A0A9P5BY11_9PLEO|nr:hypothetical protein E8E12_002033 [Didymella heteroderae]